MIDFLIPFLEEMAALGMTWGPLLVFVFMTIESSFVPFPSEIVMIPAGFMAARGEFYPDGLVWPAIAIAIACGIAGSLAGAWINYFLSLKLGRPFLHRYGKYFFIAPEKLERAEELFRKYGDATTFICRLIPVVRQLISIPAGISRMNLLRFSAFTGAGAGIWVIILTFLGYWFGSTTEGMTYGELVHNGKEMVMSNLVWILLACGTLLAVYIWAHNLAAGKPSKKTGP